MLSLRLKTLAGYYHQCHSVWDIGCDHGLLGLSFLNLKETPNIHLVDPSIDVIHTLEKKLIDSYITKKTFLNVHHKKGQDVILNPESKIIFIAGMGGKEIQEIVQNLIPQLSLEDRIVVSPHRNILETREYLMNSPLGLIEEVALKEDGQFYQILCLSKKAGLPKVSQFGLKIWHGPIGEEYRAHQMRTFRVHQDKLSQTFLAYLADFSY